MGRRRIEAEAVDGKRVALMARLALLLVTAGVTVATWTAAPLLTLSVVTMAVRLPAVAGWWRTSPVSEVAVAAVTVPDRPVVEDDRVVGRPSCRSRSH